MSQQYWNLTTYSDSFILTTTLIYKYRLQWVYNVDIKHIRFEIGLIHKPTHSDS